jgi:hypothetical protein
MSLTDVYAHVCDCICRCNHIFADFVRVSVLRVMCMSDCKYMHTNVCVCAYTCVSMHEYVNIHVYNRIWKMENL